MSIKRRNLVLVRAGNKSLHHTWISGKEQNFDLLIAAYEQSAVRENTEHVIYDFIPGNKVAGWDIIFKKHGELIRSYERIALIDDDIQISGQTISRCFDLGNSYNLSIWQPSLSAHSYCTYGASLSNDRYVLRFCNYIEMMFPFFKLSTFLEVSPLFSLGLEAGIDLIWCSIAKEAGGRCAIIDECVGTHTKPVGGEKHLNGFVGRTYEDDIYACLNKFDMRWPSWVVEEAILRNGKPVKAGIELTFSSLKPLLGVHQAPKSNRKYQIRAIIDHIRHQMFRKPYYGGNITDKLNGEAGRNEIIMSS